MAVLTDAVWAIDLGSNSLKALRLTAVSGVVEVIGFDNIRHSKLLNGTGVGAAEREELIALTLRKFVERNEVDMDEIVVSVPSQNSFARFVNLPPVEPKRIPEIVNFEAVQQIPFDINEVQWDWQLMTEEDDPQKKVGIFAIKNEVVDSALEHFDREDLQVGYVQMAPMALYNYLLYDRPDLVSSDERATVVLNIGAEDTDLVVCTQSVVWQRCILIGGNSFTKAVADAFKLNFEKAEKLKRTAPVSKYARQIFQAMRPVFTELASEVQRSLGFYTGSNPNTKITKVVAMGGGTKLRGLLKYLQQTLQVPVQRPDAFKGLAMGPGVSAAKFHENVADFGVVYGLGLQGLGLARIESNLLPRSIARSMAWASKAKYFIVAACMLLVASLLCLARVGFDTVSYGKASQTRQRISGVISDVKQVNDRLNDLQRAGSAADEKIAKQRELFDHREVVPQLYETILSALPNAQNYPAQKELYEAFAGGDVEAVLDVPRKQRRQLFVTNTSIFYSEDLATAQFSTTAMARKNARVGSAAGEYDEYEYEMMAMMEEEMMMGRGGPSSRFALSTMMPGAAQAEEAKKGFVVTIAGYSPYENVGELLEPVGVDDKPDEWGLVTRLMNLDRIVDGNSPFQLYERTDPNHFKLEKGPVDLEAEMPSGIGTWEVKAAGFGQTGENVLVDPMTKEPISKVPVLDRDGNQMYDSRNEPLYEVNDHWFVLHIKFVWTDAPESPDQGQSPAMGRMSTMRRAPMGDG
ncbi:MAG: type IV pilus assembly protein PilM [Phycisphaerales bacterium]|nr:MAG: type IV pilus assembly protein PilM [Phycisphaerales bacterium]